MTRQIRELIDKYRGWGKGTVDIEELESILTTLEASDADTVRVPSIDRTLIVAMEDFINEPRRGRDEHPDVTDYRHEAYRVWQPLCRAMLTASHPKPEPDDKAFCNKCGFYGEPQDGGFHYRPKDGVACNYSAFASPKPEPVETQPEASRSPGQIAMPDPLPDSVLAYAARSAGITEERAKQFWLQATTTAGSPLPTAQAPNEERARDVARDFMLHHWPWHVKNDGAQGELAALLIRFATDTHPVAGGEAK